MELEPCACPSTNSTESRCERYPGSVCLGSLMFSPMAQASPYFRSIIRNNPLDISGYSWMILRAWINSHKYQFATLNQTAFVSCKLLSDAGERHFLQPIGHFGPQEQSVFLKTLSQLPYTPRIYGVTKSFLDSHPEFANHFIVEADQDGANYIYEAQSLATLAGKKLQKKRNLLNQAKASYEWTVEPLSYTNVLDCLRLLVSIQGEAAKITGAEAIDASANETPNLGDVHWETCALKYVLTHFDELDATGVVVRVGRDVAGFSIYEKQKPDTAVIHFEKADRQHKGIYQVVNWETAKQIAAQGIPWINREEDMGEPGLRQAKQSYCPDHLEVPYTLTFADKH